MRESPLLWLFSRPSKPFHLEFNWFLLVVVSIFMGYYLGSKSKLFWLSYTHKQKSIAYWSKQVFLIKIVCRNLIMILLIWGRGESRANARKPKSNTLGFVRWKSNCKCTNKIPQLNWIIFTREASPRGV